MNTPPIDYNVPGGAGDTGWIVNGGDTLVVTGASSQVGEILTVSLRFVQSDRVIVDQFTISLTAGNRVVQAGTYNFQALFDNFYSGSYAQQIYLTDVSITAAVATTRGQTFCRVNLNRVGAGLSGAQVVVRCAILSDYVTTAVTACLRNSRHFTSIEGPGWQTYIYIANPGPNTDWLITVPTNARWKLQFIYATTQTDANAGSRNFNISITPSTAPAGWACGLSGFPQSELDYFEIANGVTDITSATGGGFNRKLGMPQITLLAGGQIFSISFFVGPADTWANILVSYEEWLDNV